MSTFRLFFYAAYAVNLRRPRTFLTGFGAFIASKSGEATGGWCTYEIAGPKGKITSSTIVRLFKNDRPLTYATEFDLRCHEGRRSSPFIYLSLRQFANWEIQGTDKIRLDNARHLIEDFGEEYRAYLAGPLLQVVTLFAPWPIFWFVIPTIAARIFGSRGNARAVVAVWSYIVGIVVFFAFLVYRLPERWFPTVAIYEGTSNPLERYSAEIASGGLIIGLGLAIWFYWKPRVSPIAVPQSSAAAPKVDSPPSTNQ